MRATLAAAFALTAAACAPTPADLGVDETVLESGIGRRVGSPGTCVVLAAEGKVIYRWGGAVVCGRSIASCEGGETTAEALAIAGTSRRVSCPWGSNVASWWSGTAETPQGRVGFAASMAGPDALPAIEMEARLTPVLRQAGVAVEPAV